jgi:hypothetical protein
MLESVMVREDLLIGSIRSEGELGAYLAWRNVVGAIWQFVILKEGNGNSM